MAVGCPVAAIATGEGASCDRRCLCPRQPPPSLYIVGVQDRMVSGGCLMGVEKNFPGGIYPELRLATPSNHVDACYKVPFFPTMYEGVIIN